MQRAKEIITGFNAELHSRSPKASTSSTAIVGEVVGVYVTKVFH